MGLPGHLGLIWAFWGRRLRHRPSAGYRKVEAEGHLALASRTELADYLGCFGTDAQQDIARSAPKVTSRLKGGASH